MHQHGLQHLLKLKTQYTVTKNNCKKFKSSQVKINKTQDYNLEKGRSGKEDLSLTQWHEFP